MINNSDVEKNLKREPCAKAYQIHVDLGGIAGASYSHGIRCSMGYKIIKHKKVDMDLFSSEGTRASRGQRTKV
jgi:hypothetical protein